MPEEDTSKPRAPEWALTPFSRAINDVERQTTLLRISTRGIAGLRGIPELIRALAGANDHSPSKGDLDAAIKDAETAEREISEGFPLLHQYATLGLWSTLEASMREFFVLWLENTPRAFDTDAIQKLKVRISEYEQLKGTDKYRYVIDRLENELTTTLRAGVDRFDCLFNVFGFLPRVDSETKKVLYELSAIRNVIMHQAGRADKRLLDACPWVQTPLGESITVQPGRYAVYVENTYKYLLAAIVCVSESFGVDMQEFKAN
jgi:hypothetical protein